MYSGWIQCLYCCLCLSSWVFFSSCFLHSSIHFSNQNSFFFLNAPSHDLYALHLYLVPPNLQHILLLHFYVFSLWKFELLSSENLFLWLNQLLLCFFCRGFYLFLKISTGFVVPQQADGYDYIFVLWLDQWPY